MTRAFASPLLRHTSFPGVLRALMHLLADSFVAFFWAASAAAFFAAPAAFFLAALATLFSSAFVVFSIVFSSDDSEAASRVKDGKRDNSFKQNDNHTKIHPKTCRLCMISDEAAEVALHCRATSAASVACAHTKLSETA
ncbi:hypothetical protein L596_001382 [Steinernema carpocapsae]|uniref:Uncharacterized protein n=1 Tax=Steinernema carpocapsae TaxID=34508 RepID=A0A4U8UKW5_STECR|nr:hypothetical protein L596_001382 [Steinernema carpocapsae]